MKEWLKLAIMFFLGMTLVYQYLSLRQASVVVQALRADVQAHVQALNNECVTLLTSQGFQVTKQPPPPPPEPEEEKQEDVER